MFDDQIFIASGYVPLHEGFGIGQFRPGGDHHGYGRWIWFVLAFTIIYNLISCITFNRSVLPSSTFSPLFCICAFFECMHCSCWFHRIWCLHLQVINVQSIWMRIPQADTVFSHVFRFWDPWWRGREVDDTTWDCSVHRRQEGCLWMSIRIHCEFSYYSQIYFRWRLCLWMFICSFSSRYKSSYQMTETMEVLSWTVCFCCSSSFFILFVFRYMFKSVFIILSVAACDLQVCSILC